MKKSIKNLDSKTIKNIQHVKGGDGSIYGVDPEDEDFFREPKRP